jgi:hypothetical protein
MDTVSAYRRPSIPVRPAPDLVPLPPRFRVRVSKRRLVGMVLREIADYRGDLGVALARPCVYGVFDGPLGGLKPREERCVGCLRCTVQHPQVVRIEPNPDRARLGGEWMSPECTATITYEARTGQVPVRGAGYRGPFGGAGWDGMWLDMSEIVRPTRDGIHGREYIATTVDLGRRPAYLRFDPAGAPRGEQPRVIEISVPYVFDTAGMPDPVADVVARSARWIGTLAIGTGPDRLVPVRVHAAEDVLDRAREGAGVVWLVTDRCGRAGDGRFLAELIRDAHDRLVAAGLRDQVSLLAGGGIVMADHVPKAIACGADAVVLDTVLWVALQASCTGDGPVFPHIPTEWGVQRVTNLAASWRDQLLEVLGAMGMREVRRLRGEQGRLLLQPDLERAAFAAIEGYERHAARR